MPIGRVKWYDENRGYGFVTNPGDEDVYINAAVLPEGVETLVAGQKVDYEFAAARRGPQVMRVIDISGGPRREHRFTPEQLRSMIQDMVTVLDTRIAPGLEQGHRPDRKEGRQLAEVLRTIARELES